MGSEEVRDPVQAHKDYQEWVDGGCPFMSHYDTPDEQTVAVANIVTAVLYGAEATKASVITNLWCLGTNSPTFMLTCRVLGAVVRPPGTSVELLHNTGLQFLRELYEALYGSQEPEEKPPLSPSLSG